MYNPTFLTDEELKAFILKTKMSYKKMKRESKPEKCLLCGRIHTSFCESHTIPQFVLKNIAKDGYVYRILPSEDIVPEAGTKNKVGIGETNVFYDICNECDGSYFQDYENEENLSSFSRFGEREKQRIMTLIALKNSLRDIYQDLGNIEFVRYLESEVNKINKDQQLIMNYHEEVEKQDYKDHLELREIFLNSLKANEDLFRVCYYKKMHHTVPVAIQATIVPYTDFSGKIINDTYDMGAYFKYLFICIFPLKESSIILVYCFKKDWDSTYRDYFKKFLSFRDSIKSKMLLGLALGHTDQIYLNQYAFEKLKTNPNAKKLARFNITNEEETIGNFTLQFSRNVDLNECYGLPDLLND